MAKLLVTLNFLSCLVFASTSIYGGVAHYFGPLAQHQIDGLIAIGAVSFVGLVAFTLSILTMPER